MSSASCGRAASSAQYPCGGSSTTVFPASVSVSADAESARKKKQRFTTETQTRKAAHGGAAFARIGVNSRSARIELDHQVGFHRDGIGHVRELGRADEAALHPVVVDLDVVG